MLKNYLDKIRYGLLVSLATLSFYIQPSIAQTQEESKKQMFSNYSFLTNFSTYQLNIEGGIRRALDYALGFSFAVNKGENDYLLNLRVSKEKKIGKNELIVPYIMVQGSTKYLRDEEEASQENISVGLKVGESLSDKLGLGIDIRLIDYFDKRLNNDLVAGIFISTNP